MARNRVTKSQSHTKATKLLQKKTQTEISYRWTVCVDLFYFLCSGVYLIFCFAKRGLVYLFQHFEYVVQYYIIGGGMALMDFLVVLVIVGMRLVWTFCTTLVTMLIERSVLLQASPSPNESVPKSSNSDESEKRERSSQSVRWDASVEEYPASSSDSVLVKNMSWILRNVDDSIQKHIERGLIGQNVSSETDKS